MSRNPLNCNNKQCDCCDNFHIVYFKNGFKETITERLPKDTGYTTMQKKARMMAVGFMAQAVHPADARTLLK